MNVPAIRQPPLVGGYRLPTDWLTSYAPFSDYLVPGLLLLVVIGVGGVLTAVVNSVLTSGERAPRRSLRRGRAGPLPERGSRRRATGTAWPARCWL